MQLLKVCFEEGNSALQKAHEALKDKDPVSNNSSSGAPLDCVYGFGSRNCETTCADSIPKFSTTSSQS